MKHHFAATALPTLLLILLLQIILLFQIIPTTIRAQDSSINTFVGLRRCPGEISNYTSGSQYESNLINHLLPSLIINGSRNGFLTTSFGNDPDKIYGLVQCRGDITMEDCQSCLNASSVEITQICPNKKRALIRFGKCLVRYSDLRFFSKLDSEFAANWTWANYNPISNLAVFNQQLEGLMTNLTSIASSLPSRFMTGSTPTKFEDLSKIYGLVQCTEDLSGTDCSTCLQEMFDRIRKCCRGIKGAWVLSSSCQIWYRDNLFFQLSSPPPPPPLPPPPPPGTTTTALSSPSSNDGKHKSPSSSSSSATTLSMVAIAISTVTGALLLITVCVLLKRKTRREIAGSGIIGDESLQFDLVTIINATRNFSDANKLGEGGFGAVYKGELLDGQEIAVKRLSKYSGQGSQEFKNEVVFLHKLQHRNLVKLMGCCLEGEENILIYEYVPNRSLDQYLFDPLKNADLDWKKRYKIIGGIARGLLYLHEDSRLRIIHRDLKAGNILLDAEMNAKIADFGTAKLFGVDQTQGNTSKIAGTFGYMPPEYFLHGQFSVKSDVYSFGVLILEIVSGQQISNFQQATNLLSYAWKHWTEGTALQLMDPTLTDSFSRDEVMRCIHIGLLCVQESIEDRPTMSSIVLMLNSYSLTLASPSQPPYFQHKETVQKLSSVRC